MGIERQESAPECESEAKTQPIAQTKQTNSFLEYDSVHSNKPKQA